MEYINEPLKEKIQKFVETRPYISFVQLERHIGKERFSGDKLLALPHNPMVVLWANVSEEAIRAITELAAERKIFFHPTPVETYHSDGKVLNFPLAKKCISYKTYKWFPVTLCVTPPKEKKALASPCEFL